jgi:transcriptional regulator with XRE-family HTH domain
MKKADINQILARNLKAAIERKYGEINQSQLARDSGVPQTTISLILTPERRTPLASGELPSPTLSKIAALAAKLDVNLWELLHPDPAKARREQDFYEKLEENFRNLPATKGALAENLVGSISVDEAPRTTKKKKL